MAAASRELAPEVVKWSCFEAAEGETALAVACTLLQT